MAVLGTLVRWEDGRGFGVIAPAEGGADVFVHIKAFAEVAARPKVGEKLLYELAVVDGKTRAVRVRRPGQAPRAPRGRNEAAQWGGASLLVIPLFVMLLGVLVYLWRLPRFWGLYYLAMSVLCFGVYAWDKWQAGRGGWRTPEGTLHLWALLGGWPGALLAQQYLRHKSVKTEFRAVFWLTVLLNVGAFLLLASPLGQGWLPGALMG